ncbi:LysE family translocator [Mycetohabitans rhizoxinica]|uniref:Lysine exporter protein n=1 Tax=Mycetohabitans rhizoxinica (strain DSM 19002 / CIP 109453 / HKI 454) TaxID=882378 RepID=E5ARP1_MYCRK|nr:MULTISPECIES: LysE family translocator [Mycetohabitans]MCF7695985.1 LysE family translocator [Mycetohabitans sp. B2]MCG1047306.1 LysE family translocator [Mycetohabitans sp. B6]CBW75273.1 Lysine exporter protein [Mycetohabitans rhizoxinica HKI 454]
MLEFSTLGTFVVVVLGLLLIPGPAVLLVLTRTVQGGRKIGVFTGLGVAAGDLIHTLCAAVGLSALLMTSALAFNIVKLAGVAYLLYLGVQALLEKSTLGYARTPRPAAVPPKKAFVQAMLVEVLNPEVALFFLAFLPQFAHPERGATFWQFIVLGLIFVAIGTLYLTAVIFSIRSLGRIMSRLHWLRRWEKKIIGIIFVLLGLKLAMQQ